jgi:rod shape-determining protein MreD
MLAVFDGAVLPVFQVFSVYPSFLYLFICYAAFEWGGHKTIYIAFWAGLLRDLLGSGLIGLEASLLPALALALDFLVRKMERGSRWIYFLVTFLFVFFAGVLQLLAWYTGDLPASSAWNYLGLVAMRALYTAALLPFFYSVTNRWFDHGSVKQYELFP